MKMKWTSIESMSLMNVTPTVDNHHLLQTTLWKQIVPIDEGWNAEFGTMFIWKSLFWITSKDCWPEMPADSHFPVPSSTNVPWTVSLTMLPCSHAPMYGAHAEERLMKPLTMLLRSHALMCGAHAEGRAMKPFTKPLTRPLDGMIPFGRTSWASMQEYGVGAISCWTGDLIDPITPTVPVGGWDEGW